MARRTVLLTVAVLIAALGTTLILMYVRGADARAAEDHDLVKVLTVSETINAGESLEHAQTNGKIDRSEVARGDLVEGALTSTRGLEDQVAITPIYPGEQLLPQRFSSDDKYRSLEVPDGKLAISVNLTDPGRVAGFVDPQSYVAIFYSPGGEQGQLGGTPSQTRVLLPKVQVIAVGNTTVQSRTTTGGDGQQTTEDIPRTLVTVAVDQDQAQKIILASRTGELSLALLGNGTKVTDRPGVTTTELLSGQGG